MAGVLCLQSWSYCHNLCWEHRGGFDWKVIWLPSMHYGILKASLSVQVQILAESLNIPNTCIFQVVDHSDSQLPSFQELEFPRWELSSKQLWYYDSFLKYIFKVIFNYLIKQQVKFFPARSYPLAQIIAILWTHIEE